MTTDTTLSEGLHLDVPFDEYRAIDAVNQSLLKNFRHSAAMVKHRMGGGSFSSPALEFGTAFHAAILEPDVYAAEYAVAPVADKRTKAWKEFKAENEGRKILSLSDAEDLAAMRDQIEAHPEASALLGGSGQNEATLIWKDPMVGTLCKARADRLTVWNDIHLAIVDLKTTTSAAPRDFSRDAARYGYHLQAAWYIRAMNAIAPNEPQAPVRRFFIVAVEKTAPHCVAVYELEEEAIEAGSRQITEYLVRFEECRERDEWPSPAGSGIETLYLPAWATGGGDG